MKNPPKSNLSLTSYVTQTSQSSLWTYQKYVLNYLIAKVSFSSST